MTCVGQIWLGVDQHQANLAELAHDWARVPKVGKVGQRFAEFARNMWASGEAQSSFGAANLAKLGQI